MTKQLKKASLQPALDIGREISYLVYSQTCKEEVGLEIAQRDHLDQGLLGILTCVEPCLSYEIYMNRDSHKLEFQHRLR